MRHGGYFCRSFVNRIATRLEVRVVDRETGEIVGVHRQTSLTVDLSEQIGGKTALQKAAADAAESLLPKIARANR